jgi:hypothetical protein
MEIVVGILQEACRAKAFVIKTRIPAGGGNGQTVPIVAAMVFLLEAGVQILGTAVCTGL